jgi:FMN phosphatase YigB (HAD superfamily)
MADQAPTLVVDAGGTLIGRDRPGLTARVIAAVRRAEGLADEAEPALRAAVLTTADPEACLRVLGPLAPGTRRAVAAVLAEDPGTAVVLPGALELLTAAVEFGWRVIVASNAGPGTPTLPPELGRYLSGVAESRHYGLVKEDPRFWRLLLARERLDPRLTLVAGDSPAADQRAPASAGLQSQLVTRDGSGLALLTAGLRAAGLRPPGAIAVLGGHGEQWAGRTVVTAPHLGFLVERVTRARVRFTTRGTSGSAVVARRRALPPAVTAAGTVPLPGVAWLIGGRERPPYTVPADLATLLNREGLSLDVLSASERRHALSMIHEARADGTLAERMADLVSFLLARSEKERPDDSAT